MGRARRGSDNDSPLPASVAGKGGFEAVGGRGFIFGIHAEMPANPFWLQLDERTKRDLSRVEENGSHTGL
ncbi:hypothetical protein GCM10011591_33490 [Nocardia camponoti]|uniref:Uncharacterized protein n=1 Tax=Nocardia camponoti TaxID=1616106 RepID=A0A917QMC4_9NOCA|nr:hypothetical protein GCM10011591_33490 [Nocardia camponoti]